MKTRGRANSHSTSCSAEVPVQVQRARVLVGKRRGGYFQFCGGNVQCWWCEASPSHRTEYNCAGMQRIRYRGRCCNGGPQVQFGVAPRSTLKVSQLLSVPSATRVCPELRERFIDTTTYLEDVLDGPLLAVKVLRERATSQAVRKRSVKEKLGLNSITSSTDRTA